MKNKIYIYHIYFLTSNKRYIGQSNNIKKRLIEHKVGKWLVGKAIRKYDDWVVTILYTCKTRDEANRVEIEEIRNFNSVFPNGYNLTRGGDGMDGYPHSEETKAKLRDANIGRKHKEETKKKISESLKGNKNALGHRPSDAARAKMSPNSKGMKGKRHTVETKAKMSIAQKARWQKEGTNKR